MESPFKIYLGGPFWVHCGSRGGDQIIRPDSWKEIHLMIATSSYGFTALNIRTDRLDADLLDFPMRPFEPAIEALFARLMEPVPAISGPDDDDRTAIFVAPNQWSQGFTTRRYYASPAIRDRLAKDLATMTAHEHIELLAHARRIAVKTQEDKVAALQKLGRLVA